MTKYLISFPAAAMDPSPENLAAASRDSREVVRAAKDAGVWVFGGGINDGVDTVRVSGDSTITPGAYPELSDLTGGFAVLEVQSREEALQWAARIAAACRCDQEVREFHYDPES